MSYVICRICANVVFCRAFVVCRILKKQMETNLFKAKISLLPCVNADDSEIENTSLGRVLIADTWRAQVEAVRAEKDPAKRKALKAALPCFTPSGIFSHVSRAGLVRHSGFISLDIDYKPEKGVNTNLAGYDLKAAISAVPNVAYCGHSCGGAGYVVIVPIADPAKHREYFRALAYYFERAGLELDPACKDVTRKRFVSWDAAPYVNTAAQPWALTLPQREHATRETLGHDLDADETAAQVEAVIKACEANRWDITADYADWMRILAALASTFGEAGRDYAHRISALYSGYQAAETDAKFTSLLQHPADTPAQIGTFFYIARQEIGKHDFDNLSL